MAVKRRQNFLGQQRVDVPHLKSVESAMSNDFDELIQGLVIGQDKSYVVRGLTINVSGAIGSSANGLQMIVEDSAFLHGSSAVSGTFYTIPENTPAEILSSTTNQRVEGSFTPNTSNYIGIEFVREVDDSTVDQVYFWNPTTNVEITRNVPLGIILDYKIVISTSNFAANTMPISVVETDGSNNVVSVEDRREMLHRLATAGESEPNPFYSYDWADGRSENFYRSSSSTSDPFAGGDKQIKTMKEFFDALMTEFKLLKGTPYWYSENQAGSLYRNRQDLGNTAFAGKGSISHAIAFFEGQVAGMTTDVILRATNSATLTADGIKDIDTLISEHNTENTQNPISLVSGNGSQVPTVDISLVSTPGQMNWSADNYLDFIGGRLSYKILANPTSTELTLTDNQVAYINLVRGVDVIPNLIFTNGGTTVTSVGGANWTNDVSAGDFIKDGSKGDEFYYKIDSVDSLSQVTLSQPFQEASSGPGGFDAQYAWGTYETNPAPSTNRHIFIADRGDVPFQQDVFWLYYRKDDGGSPRVYVRMLGGQELEAGEVRDVSDNTAQAVLDYIGSSSESDSTPNYTESLGVSSLPEITTITLDLADNLNNGEYFFINSANDLKKYAIYVNKDGGNGNPNLGNRINVGFTVTSGDSNIATAANLFTALDNLPDFNTVNNGDGTLTVTNAEIGRTTDATNVSMSGSFSISINQQGQGELNKYINDGENLTISIKRLDESLEEVEQSLSSLNFDRVVYVSAEGSDVFGEGNGSIIKPFASIKKAMDLIQDASTAKKYAIVLGPKRYTESNDLVFKANVSIVGISGETTVVEKQDGTPIVHLIDQADRFEYKDIVFTDGLTIEHATGDTSSTFSKIDNIKTPNGDFVFNGIGNTDVLDITNSTISQNINLQGVDFKLLNSHVIGNLNANDTNSTTPISAIIQGSILNNVTTTGVTNDIDLSMYGNQTLGIITIDDQGSTTPNNLKIDAISTPSNDANLVLTNNATINKVTEAYGTRYDVDFNDDWEVTPPDNVHDALTQSGALRRYLDQLRLEEHPTNKQRVIVTGADKTLLNTSTLSQVLRNLLIKFSGAEIDFGTGEIFEDDGTTPLGIDFTPFTIGANEFFNYSVTLIPSTVNADNTINAQVIVLPASASNAVAVNAPKAPFANGIQLGAIQVQENGAGGILDILQANITQLGVGGAGGGGTGDANELLERLKNRFNNGIYEYMTPVIFSSSEEELVDGSSTAEFSIVETNYEFPTIGNQLVSVQMLDNEFLNPTDELGNPIDPVNITSIELIKYWDLENLDESAIYEVSRNGGAEWQAVTMERIGQSDTYRGVHTFSDEVANSFTQSVGGAVTNVLPLTDSNVLNRQFTLVETTTIKTISANVTVAGTPQGYIFAEIVKDDGGSPSTNLEDIVSRSAFVNTDGLASGVVGFDIEATMTTGNYHVLIKSDSVYKAQYTASSGANNVSVDEDGTAIVFDLGGFELDLRVRITSGTAEVVSEGFGIFYKDLEPIELIGGQILRDIKQFVGDVDNTDTFELNFLPDPRLLVVYELGTGQAYRYGAFVLDGNKVIFEPNTFNKPETVRLEFLQVNGSSFDNSDTNAALLAANHLGSTDASVDLSVAGRGWLSRSPDGTLYEIVIKDGGTGFDIYEVT